MLCPVKAQRLLLVGSVTLASCSSAAPRATAPSAPSPAVTVSAPAAPRVDACRARPSTVYGDEPIVFELDGPASEASVAVELRDAHGQKLGAASLAVPGSWQAPSVPSGDFSLRVVASDVTCWVTVNRELPRASSGAR
jgi:hypothetical protein